MTIKTEPESRKNKKKKSETGKKKIQTPEQAHHVEAGKTSDVIKLRKALISDAPIIHELVLFYAKREEMLPRAYNEIYENIRDFTVIEKNGKVVACGGLHVCWSDLAEVKSLAVKLEEARKGYGSKLVKFAVKEARALGIKRIFTLTFKEGFFRKMGFSRVDVNDLPKKVWFECVRCVHFPDCDEIAMVMDI